jgi:Uma2 family endonuclease
MTDIVDTIKKSVKLPAYYKEIQDYINAEKKKRKEFYKIVKEDDKAEFINGEMIFHSPVNSSHLLFSGFLYNLLSNYVNNNDLGRVYYDKAMISLERNDYEPDIVFFSKQKAEVFKPDQMLFPVPDFVVEFLSKSTEKNDRGVKFTDYAYNGISEYWIIDPEKKTLEQYLLRNGQYFLLLKTDKGVVNCHTIPEFRIPVKSIFEKDLNIKTLTELLK